MSFIEQKTKTLNELCQEIKVPKFQRHLVWKKEQKEDLLRSIILKRPIGNLIIWNKNNADYLIDGLQRFTSIKIISKCMYLFLNFDWLIKHYSKNFYNLNSAKIKTFIKDFNFFKKNEIDSSKNYNQKDLEDINNLFEKKPRNYDLLLLDVCEDMWKDHYLIIKEINNILKNLSQTSDSLKEYKFFCLYWKCDNEDDVIEGFEKLNNKGTKLTIYDLLFSRWSSKIESFPLPLSSREEEQINKLYYEKDLDINIIPKVDSKNLTIPEVIWLLIFKSDINTKTKSNLLGNIIKNEKTKNAKIYLYTFILLFCFEADEENNYNINKDLDKKQLALGLWIKKLEKESVDNLAFNLDLINKKITKKIMFINTNENYKNEIKKYGVGKFVFLTIFGMIVWHCREKILEPGYEFNNFLEKDESLTKFFQKIDWEVIKIIFSEELKTASSKNALKYALEKDNLIKNYDIRNSDKEWKQFFSKFKALKIEDSRQKNFNIAYKIINVVNFFVLSSKNDNKYNPKNYNLDFFVSKNILEAKTIEQITEIGNLSIYNSIKYTKGRWGIDKDLFEHDLLTNYLKENNFEAYMKLKDLYLNKLKNLSEREDVEEFKKIYNQTISIREETIIEIFKKHYLNLEDIMT